MKGTKREKICISCEGRIASDAEICPYCSTKQSGSHSSQGLLFEKQSLQDSLTSLYTPPYQGKKPQFSFVSTEAKEDPSPFVWKEEKEEKNLPLENETKSGVWPILLLLSGVHFSLLGLAQLFFSKEGILQLEWNADYWFFYCLFGFPLLYIGYKKVKGLKI